MMTDENERKIDTGGGRYVENKDRGNYIEHADNVYFTSNNSNSEQSEHFQIHKELSMQEVMILLQTFEKDLDKRYQVSLKITEIDQDQGSI